MFTFIQRKKLRSHPRSFLRKIETYCQILELCILNVFDQPLAYFAGFVSGLAW